MLVDPCDDLLRALRARLGADAVRLAPPAGAGERVEGDDAAVAV
jgi:hypothetical protein